MQDRRISHPTPGQNQVSAQDLGARALIPSIVRDDAQIYPGRSADVEETARWSTPREKRGDLLIRNIWKHQTDCILDVLVTNLDTSNIHRKAEGPSFPW